MKLNNNLYQLLFYGYTILLILIAILPINSSGSAINHTFVVSIRLDYLLHCAIFIPWVFLFQMLIRLDIKTLSMKTLGWVVAGLLFAMTMELVQYILPYRAFNVNDLLANVIGVVLGYLILIFSSLLFSIIRRT